MKTGRSKLIGPCSFSLGMTEREREREKGTEYLKSETEAHQWHNGALCLGEQGTCRESWWQCCNVTKPGSSSGNQRRGTLATKHVVIRSASALWGAPSLLLPGWGSEPDCFLSVCVFRSWQSRQTLAVILGRINIWLDNAQCDDMGPTRVSQWGDMRHVMTA